MVLERQNRDFNNFYNSTCHNEVLEPKTTCMIQVAAAMAFGCSP